MVNIISKDVMQLLNRGAPWLYRKWCNSNLGTAPSAAETQAGRASLVVARGIPQEWADEEIIEFMISLVPILS